MDQNVLEEKLVSSCEHNCLEIYIQNVKEQNKKPRMKALGRV